MAAFVMFTGYCCQAGVAMGVGRGSQNCATRII
jgi:hypothetical protein